MINFNTIYCIALLSFVLICLSIWLFLEYQMYIGRNKNKNIENFTANIKTTPIDLDRSAEFKDVPNVLSEYNILVNQLENSSKQYLKTLHIHKIENMND